MMRAQRPEYRARIRAALMKYGPRMSKDELHILTGIERRVLGRVLSRMVDELLLKKDTKYWLL